MQDDHHVTQDFYFCFASFIDSLIEEARQRDAQLLLPQHSSSSSSSSSSFGGDAFFAYPPSLPAALSGRRKTGKQHSSQQQQLLQEGSCQPTAKDKEELTLSFLVCQSVRLHLKVLQQQQEICLHVQQQQQQQQQHFPSWKLERQHLQWHGQQQQKRRHHQQQLLRQHASLHCLLALAFSYTTPNTFVGPRLQISVATAT
ncbi:forkhead box protein P2-like, partial [Cyclospora cayetanensis]|uniref:Forkhead box protein P2-like n=1 Tax=Cyclospora cayetanensis TaxID=88456 RepID=A0A6P6RRM8_9EIME